MQQRELLVAQNPWLGSESKKMLIQHIEELKQCTDLFDLKQFSRKYAGADKYARGFLEALSKEKTFDKGLQRVWNFALQQDGKYYIGRESYVKVKHGGAITGLECHSDGHRV